MRQCLTTIRAIAGCFVCNGPAALWTASNAMAVAARHHDATGHETWADQTLTVRYVAIEPKALPPDPAEGMNYNCMCAHPSQCDGSCTPSETTGDQP